MAILVVDDTAEGRSIFTLVLVEAGYSDVVAADSAAEAFSILAIELSAQKAASFDLILLDLMMPDTDGFLACKRIRSDKRYTDVPIVMTTAVDDMESVNKAFKCGATGYLTKPLKRVDLLACVISSLQLKTELDRRNAVERELQMHKPFSFPKLIAEASVASW